MYPRRAARRFSAWIALVAMLAGGLLPVSTHALSPADPFGPICTVEGSRAPAPTPPDAPAGHLLEHCIFCASHEGGPALPQAQRPPVAAVEPPPPLYLDAVATPASRPQPTAARPRAPPSVS